MIFAMLMRHLHWFFLVLAVVLAGLAGYSYYLESDTAGAYIEAPDRELTTLRAGQHVVTFPLHNPTRHPVRVVGATSC